MPNQPSPQQQKLLDFIAKEHLVKKHSDVFLGVSWRRLWSQFKAVGEEALRAALQSCVPIYLLYSPQPNDSYVLTLEGWLESSSAPLVSRWLEDILRFLRKRFDEDPDFQRYTSVEIAEVTKTSPEEAFAVHELIKAANLSSGGTSGYAPTQPYHFECRTPYDIVELSQCENVGALRRLRAPQQQPTRPKTAAPIPAYILSLSVENVRCFGPKQLLDLSDGSERPRPWTIILGNNGTGKTTLLQAIASFAQIEDQDARLAFQRGFSLIDSFPRKGAPPLRTEIKVAFGKDLQQDSYQQQTYSWQLGSEASTFPIALYAYGASRRMGTGALSEDQLQDPIATLFSDVPLQNAEEMLLQYDYTATKEPNTGNGRRAAAMRDRLKNLLTSGVLPEITDLKFETSQSTNGRPRSEVLLQTPDGWIAPHDLGLGYQTMIAWIVDLVSRQFECYPNSEDPLAEPAIVLIDEIDLHLHPRWQREMISHLCERFPNTQFIATAHSPLVVQAAEDANIVVLRREEDHVVIDKQTQSVQGWRVDQILTSDIFELSSTRSITIEAKFEERRVLLQNKKPSKKDKERLAQLEKELESLPGGDTKEDMDAVALIRETARILREQKQKAP